MTTKTETFNPFLLVPTEDAEFERLPPGCYDAVCCAVVAKEFPDYNDRDKLVPKIFFVFQVAGEGGGQLYYLKTKPFRSILGAKANIVAFIQQWCGCDYKYMVDNHFSAEKMVGYSAQLVVGEETSKKDGKVYSTILNVLRPKKGQATAVIQDELPEFVTKDNIGLVLAQGVTERATFPVQSQSSAPVPVEAPKSSAPAVPAGAKVTKAKDAKGWISNPPAQPADAVPNVGATAPEEDDDSDLPF